jgi:hypothetical protein
LEKRVQDIKGGQRDPGGEREERTTGGGRGRKRKTPRRWRGGRDGRVTVAGQLR